MKGKWTRMEQPVSPSQQQTAVTMWKHGCNTLEIARAIKLPEYQVYNSLPKWRGRT